jgi:uncharacterized protein YfaS (alpha-2-macroglobulin family)
METQGNRVAGADACRGSGIRFSRVFRGGWNRLSRWLVLVLALALATTEIAGIGAQERGEKPEKTAPRKVEPLILVINYPYQITGQASTKIHVTLFKPDFSPAAGAEVKINKKKVGVADANGTCIFDLVPGEGQSHTLTAELDSKGRKYKVRKGFSSNARTESFRSDQLFVYTDRAVYNPGDEILVRLLAWELLADYKAIPKAEISLMLQNAAGKVFTGEKLATNEFGVAATRLPLPENMAEGDYELVVLYNQAREKARLRVERFVPPVIEVKHDIKRFLTPAQDSMQVSLALAYFAGGKPASATVTLHVADAAGTAILKKDLGTTTDAKLAFTLDKKELDTIRARLQPEQPFKMTLTATDAFARSSMVTRDVVYTQRPYRAVLELDKDDYPAGETVKLHAKVTDLDGKPARGIDLTCKVAEFGVNAKAVSDDQGVAEFSFTMGKSAATAVVESPVMPVPLGSIAVRFNLPKPMTSKAEEPPQKQGVQTHLKVTFDKEYMPVEKVVHVDLTDLSGALVASTTIPVTRDGDDYRSEGTITAPTWGTMLVNLYVAAAKKSAVGKGGKLSVKNVGFITEGQHVTLYPDAEATITVHGLKPRVAPGEKVIFEVEVKTRSGQEAALGAALVDQAVISLMDPLEVTPKDHFYNPQRKVISTGGAAVLTWPVVDRNWGEPWRDIAYTNWGFKDPGGMVSAAESGEMLEGEGGGGFGAGSGVVSGVGSADGAAYGGSGGIGSGTGKGMVKAKVSKKGMLNLLTAGEEAKMEEAEAPAPAQAMASIGDQPADEDTGVARDRRGGGDPAQGQPLPRITIRTKFPETALWEPLLATTSGRSKLEVTFPDAITVQQLTLIASDKAGGLGILRQDVEVRQDLYVQSDFPATLTQGDEVKVAALVRNLSGAKVSLVAEAGASGLEFVGGTKHTLELEDGAAAPLVWTVRAAFAGKVEYSIAVAGPSFRDEERKTLFVRPIGVPAVREFDGELAAGKAFEADVAADPKASYRTAFLSVSFPNVIPAIEAWKALDELPLAFVGVYGTASRLLLDCAMLEWGMQGGMPAAELEKLRGRVLRAVATLVSVQTEDGAWGWTYLADASHNRTGFRVSVYLSAFVLKALAEAASLDVPVDNEVLTKGIAYLLAARNDKGLWAAQGAYFWEVNAPEVDMALSAELFSILVQASKALGGVPGNDLLVLKQKMSEFLATRPEEPAAVAHAVTGILTMNRWASDKTLYEPLEQAVDFLITLKREGHWEPHWYHAYGGMVELNALILEMLREFKLPKYEGVEREIVTRLLSTREAWGAWHNEIGTVNAVRALLAAGAGTKVEKASRVTVKVDGGVVAEVEVDPADPFLSAARLRTLELTPFLRSGTGRVTVEYDGALTVPVALELKEWGVRKDEAGPRGPLSVTRTSASTAGMGEPSEVTVIVRADKPVPHVQVIDRLPTNAEPDTDSLEALVKAGVVSCYLVQPGQVAFELERLEGTAELRYKLIATRAGAASHGGTEVMARYSPEIPPAVAQGEAFLVN